MACLRFPMSTTAAHYSCGIWPIASAKTFTAASCKTQVPHLPWRSRKRRSLPTSHHSLRTFGNGAALLSPEPRNHSAWELGIGTWELDWRSHSTRAEAPVQKLTEDDVIAIS